MSLRDRVHRFNSALLAAEKLHVGKFKSGRYTKPWSIPDLREAIKKQNALRRTQITGLNTWKTVPRHASCQKNPARGNRRNSSLTYNPDPARTLRTFKSLSGTPSSNLHHRTRQIQRLYEGIRPRFNKEERDRILQLKSTLISSTAGESCCAVLQKVELNEAILQICTKGAQVPRARQELLGIFNLSFSSGNSPQTWKTAIVRPLKKAGKPPGCISSYRPVSLPSCVAKMLERILHSRLNHLAETRNWLCTEKASFRKNMSCKDQILHFMQLISDNYQAPKPKKDLPSSPRLIPRA